MAGGGSDVSLCCMLKEDIVVIENRKEAQNSCFAVWTLKPESHMHTFHQMYKM